MKQYGMTLFGLLACCLSMTLVSCRKHDVRTVLIHVPEMRNRACVDVVQDALSKVQGLQWNRTEIDLSRRTVTVTYDSMQMSLKNVEFAIADAGFRANNVPANEEAAAKLPDACLE